MRNKLCLLLFIFSFFAEAQEVYNKDVKAIIKIDKTSEFVTFSATSENLTLSDYNLRYEFMAFKTDANNNTSKSLQSDRFFLEGSEKKILSSVTINNNIDGKTILVLLIYPVNDNDAQQGAIGKDRLVITNALDGGGLKIELDSERQSEVKEELSADQDTSAKDGIFFEGLIIQKTLTKSGRDFYKYFYSEYYNKQIKTGKNILIEEVPGQRRSTRISVKVDGQLVWQFFSNPKKEFLKDMANRALNNCIKYLQQLSQQKQSLKRY